MTRKEMVEELRRLEPSRKLRAIHLRRDDDSLARAIERLRAARPDRAIDDAGLDLRLVERVAR